MTQRAYEPEVLERVIVLETQVGAIVKALYGNGQPGFIAKTDSRCDAIEEKSRADVISLEGRQNRRLTRLERLSWALLGMGSAMTAIAGAFEFFRMIAGGKG